MERMDNFQRSQNKSSTWGPLICLGTCGTQQVQLYAFFSQGYYSYSESRSRSRPRRPRDKAPGGFGGFDGKGSKLIFWSRADEGDLVVAMARAKVVEKVELEVTFQPPGLEALPDAW